MLLLQLSFFFRWNPSVVIFPEEESPDVSGGGGGAIFTGGPGETCRTPDGAGGVCTILPQCSSLYAMLDVPSPAVLNYLRMSICGYRAFDPEVANYLLFQIKQLS